MFTDNKDIADLWLLNSCTVKNPAEDHFRQVLPLVVFNSVDDKDTTDLLIG